MKEFTFIISFFILSFSFSQTTYNVYVDEMSYSPNDLYIEVGDQVQFIHEGSGLHDVNFTTNSITGELFNNPAEISTLPSNGEYQSEAGLMGVVTFDAPGVYNYDCSMYGHASMGMVGSIIVEEVNTIVDIIVDSENHNTLETALMVAGLVETLNSDGPWTVFAPTDAAFEALPDGLLDDLLANTESLTSILSHHVVSGIGLSTDLYEDYNGLTVPTLNDTEILVTVDGNSIMIDNALIITADLVADNGVVHVIDTVLLPEGGCVDDNSIIDDAFQTLSTCLGTIDFLMTNYAYTNEEACLWDGNMGNGSLFGGLSMVDFCECSCADFSNLSISQSNFLIKEILYKVDILGNIIKNQVKFNSPYFIIYRDGSVKKFVKIK